MHVNDSIDSCQPKYQEYPKDQIKFRVTRIVKCRIFFSNNQNPGFMMGTYLLCIIDYRINLSYS